MLKSQQCTACYGMFESGNGKHNPHAKKTNVTEKGTKQEWVCNTCREKINKKKNRK